jgi:ABC-2 type transport system permease protein
VRAGGNIYDLGYQGYDGVRLGRPAVVRGLLRATLASAYGIGRGGRAKIAPFTLAAIALLPAVLAVGFSAIARQAGPGAGEVLDEASPIRHSTYQGVTATLIMLFCAAQAPELFGKDQRYGVLPLYFSRLLTRPDYAFARAGGLFVAVWLVAVVPHLVLTLGSVLAASDPVSGLADEAADVPRYLVGSTLSTGLLAIIAAVIAAWTPRRAYATAAIIAVFIIPSVVTLVFSELAAGDVARLLVLVSPGDIIDGLNATIYGTIADSPAVQASGLPGWAYVVACVVGIVGGCVLLVRRYVGLSI